MSWYFSTPTSIFAIKIQLYEVVISKYIVTGNLDFYAAAVLYNAMFKNNL